MKIITPTPFGQWPRFQLLPQHFVCWHRPFATDDLQQYWFLAIDNDDTDLWFITGRTTTSWSQCVVKDAPHPVRAAFLKHPDYPLYLQNPTLLIQRIRKEQRKFEG